MPTARTITGWLLAMAVLTCSAVLTSGTLAAEEFFLFAPDFEEEQRSIGGYSNKAGRERPAVAAPTMVWRVDWEEYRTLIVVETGTAVRRPAWVTTMNRQDGSLVVCYVGTAFTDEDGEVHIDCRWADIAGPQASNWSPDSFAIREDGSVRVIDDADRGNGGTVASSLTARAEAGAPLSLAYQAERLFARWSVTGAM